jgi:hypothetical protein
VPAAKSRGERKSGGSWRVQLIGAAVTGRASRFPFRLDDSGVVCG